MSTRTGFPRMDWDTGFLADPKFQHLRDLLSDPIQFGYAGFCYLRLAADAWRTCERHPIGEIVRGVETWAADALRSADLLGADYRITTETFDKWVGSGIMAREVWAEKKRKGRESHRVPVDSPGVSGTPPTGRIGSVGTVGPVDEVGTFEGVQGEDEVWTFLAQHGAYIRPDAPLGRRLVGLLERRGTEVIMAEAAKLAKDQPVMSDRQWVLGLENAVEKVPTGRVSPEERIEEATTQRSNGIFERMLARRIEQYHFTGTWPEEWGEKPEGLDKRV